MAKASFASKDAYEPKLGFQEGYFEVVEATTRVFQYPPNRESGEQTGPFLCARLMLQKLDERGNPTEDEPMEKILRIEKDLRKMRPGFATSREDTDPEDRGDELDAEGNVIFCEEGAKININSAFQTFMHSLEEKGFKSEILGAGYLPDLIGLKAHGVPKKGEKRNINGREVEPAYFVVDKILVRPYETSAPAATPKKTAASTTTRTPKEANGVPPAPVVKTAAPPAAATGEAEDIATGILIELAGELDGETRDGKKLYAMAYSRLVKLKDRDKKLDKSVQDLFKNEEWLTTKAEELGFNYAGGVFTFGEPRASAA